MARFILLEEGEELSTNMAFLVDSSSVIRRVHVERCPAIPRPGMVRGNLFSWSVMLKSCLNGIFGEQSQVTSNFRELVTCRHVRTSQKVPKAFSRRLHKSPS